MAQENQFLSVIRIWAALAWADGRIAPAEAAALKRLIGSAELTEDERETALGWLKSEVELDTTSVQDLSESARHGIYRAAAQLAAVDLDVADKERVFLDRLRDALRIGEDDAKAIEATVTHR